MADELLLQNIKRNKWEVSIPVKVGVGVETKVRRFVKKC